MTEQYALVDLIGFGFLRTWSKLDNLKETVMALQDTLDQLTSEDATLATEVAEVVSQLAADKASIDALNATIAQLQAGTPVSADQLAALQKVADDLGTSNTTLAAALPAAPPAPSA